MSSPLLALGRASSRFSRKVPVKTWAFCEAKATWARAQTGFATEKDQFWFGSDSLWIELPANGTWNALPESNQGFTQKILWWSREYAQDTEPQPAITVSGQRLDGKAPELVFSKPTNGEADRGAFMLVGVEFPVEGCWQITGTYKNETLTFTVLVKQ